MAVVSAQRMVAYTLSSHTLMRCWLCSGYWLNSRSATPHTDSTEPRYCAHRSAGSDTARVVGETARRHVMQCSDRQQQWSSHLRVRADVEREHRRLRLFLLLLGLGFLVSLAEQLAPVEDACRPVRAPVSGGAVSAWRRAPAQRASPHATRRQRRTRDAHGPQGLAGERLAKGQQQQAGEELPELDDGEVQAQARGARGQDPQRSDLRAGRRTCACVPLAPAVRTPQRCRPACRSPRSTSSPHLPHDDCAGSTQQDSRRALGPDDQQPAWIACRRPDTLTHA